MSRHVITRPSWELFHQEVPESEHPWNHPEEDTDILACLPQQSAGAILEIGTGSGYQLLDLLQRGYQVTGSDLAEHSLAAIRARLAAAGQETELLQLDIRQVTESRQWDTVVDRGVFHCMHPDERAAYAAGVSRLLRPGGRLVIKCFSDQEVDRGIGPYLISEAIIRDTLGGSFELHSCRPCRFQLQSRFFDGWLPHALLLDLRRRA